MSENIMMSIISSRYHTSGNRYEGFIKINGMKKNEIKKLMFTIESHISIAVVFGLNTHEFGDLVLSKSIVVADRLSPSLFPIYIYIYDLLSQTKHSKLNS
jgi:hypothetical protein